jgi:ammonia channel protein AmtB
VVSKGDAFWTFSGGLAGVFTASAGNDLYHPIQAMIIAAIGVGIVYRLHCWVERKFKLDDAVGAGAGHGYSGFVGLVISGFVLWGVPSSPYEGYAAINPVGQFIGALIMFVGLGFLPGFILAKMQAAAGVLRIPEEVELEGLDYAEHHAYEDAKAEIIEADKEYLAAKATPAE